MKIFSNPHRVKENINNLNQKFELDPKKRKFKSEIQKHVSKVDLKTIKYNRKI